MSKKYTNLQVTKLPKQEVEMTAEISAKIMAEMREKAISKIKETIEIDGFRKGNAPENMIVARVGEMKILEEAGQIALETVYPDILEDEKIDAIGRPEVTITKIAPGNPMEFKVKTAVAPEVKLADYGKIAKGQKLEARSLKLEVTDKEIDEVILDIRRNVAHTRMHQQPGMSEHDHSHDDIKDEDLPEVDETFLKEIGGFPTVEALRAQIKEGVSREKETKAKDKRRTDIMGEIIKDSTLEIPQVIVDAEIEKMLAQFKDDIARSGVSYEEYLKHIKKSEEEVRKEWQGTAEKRAKAQLVLHHIAREEKIEPKEEDIKKEMEQILSHDKNLDRFRVRMFVDNFLTNELVFQFLENK